MESTRAIYCPRERHTRPWLTSRQIAQAFLPFGFQGSRHQSIFRFDCLVLTLGTFGFVACPFHRQTPLTPGRVLVCFELPEGEFGGLHRGGREGLEKSVHHGLIDLDTANVQTVHPASLDDILAGAMIAGRSVAAPVVSV